MRLVFIYKYKTYFQVKPQLSKSKNCFTCWLDALISVTKHTKSWLKYLGPNCNSGKSGVELSCIQLTIYFFLPIRHSDVREFSCPDCGKQFKRKDKMKEHFRRMHSLDRMSKLEAAKKKKAIGQPDKEPTHKFVPKVLTLSRNFLNTMDYKAW